MEDLHGATLGVPSDPGREFDEMVDEIVEEVRRRRGSEGLPGDVSEVRRQVQESLFKKARSGEAGGGLEKVADGLKKE